MERIALLVRRAEGSVVSALCHHGVNDSGGQGIPSLAAALIMKRLQTSNCAAVIGMNDV